MSTIPLVQIKAILAIYKVIKPHVHTHPQNNGEFLQKLEKHLNSAFYTCTCMRKGRTYC